MHLWYAFGFLRPCSQYLIFVKTRRALCLQNLCSLSANLVHFRPPMSDVCADVTYGSPLSLTADTLDTQTSFHPPTRRSQIVCLSVSNAREAAHSYICLKLLSLVRPIPLSPFMWYICQIDPCLPSFPKSMLSYDTAKSFYVAFESPLEVGEAQWHKWSMQALTWDGNSLQLYEKCTGLCRKKGLFC